MDVQIRSSYETTPYFGRLFGPQTRPLSGTPTGPVNWTGSKIQAYAVQQSSLSLAMNLYIIHQKRLLIWNVHV